MIYVIKGNEPSFIENKVKEISNKENREIIKFDGNSNSFSIQEMIDACCTNSLFNESTCVIVKDPYFLINKISDSEAKTLDSYINSPLYECDLILYTLDNSFNTRLKTYKDISSNAQVLSLDGLDYKNFNSYCYSRIKEEGIVLSKELSYYLINICKRNASLFNANLDILKLYPSKIDENVISKLCTSSDNNLVFDLINAICEKDISKTISLERKLLSENDSILGVIALLANSLRQTYYVGYLLDNGYKKSQIIDETKSSEYIINKNIDTLRKISKEKILKLLANLSDLECSCKSENTIPDNSKLELFILDLLKKEDSYAIN